MRETVQRDLNVSYTPRRVMRRIVSTLVSWAFVWWLGFFLYHHPQWKQAVFLPTLVGLIFGFVGVVGEKMVHAAFRGRRWIATTLWLSTGVGVMLLIAWLDVVQTIAVGHRLIIGLTTLTMMVLMPLLGMWYRSRR